MEDYSAMYERQIKLIGNKLKGTRKGKRASYYYKITEKGKIKEASYGSYRNYLLKLREAYKKMDRRGLKMYDDEVLTSQEFYAEYESRKREGDINITREIVEDQKYKYSYKQARAIRQALKEHPEISPEYYEDFEDEDYELPELPSYQEIRSAESLEEFIDFNEIKNWYDSHKDEYRELYGQARYVEEMQKHIGRYYFGSK